MKRNYRWFVVAGAAVLALAGGFYLNHWAAAAAPGYRGYAGGRSYPGFAAGPGYSGSGATGAYGPGRGPWGGGWGGPMMGGADPQQAWAWMQQMHNAMWGGGYAYGGSGNNGATGQDQVPNTPADPNAQRVSFSLRLSEWKIDPATISAPAGSRLVLTIYNDADEPHNFAIPALGVRLAGIAPGTSRQVEVNLDKAGTYDYLCDLPGHAQLGQRGTLTVTAAGVN